MNERKLLLGRPGIGCGSTINYKCDFRQALCNLNTNGGPYCLVSERIHSFENALQWELQLKSVLGVGAREERGKSSLGILIHTKSFSMEHE